ncbi:cation/hydrogen exchanger family protein [Salix suchowensis]|nr:cation/hydrogen exchanger family protein [Salix suchowensis]
MVESSGYLVKGAMDDLEACYFVNQTGGNYFQSTSALTSSLPLFALQLSAVLFTTRLLLLILRPLRQPSIVSLIIAGVVLGPSVLGAAPLFSDHVLPFKAVKLLETFANLALVYYMFLFGLEMDLNPIMNSGSVAIWIAVSGILIPLGFGFGLFYLLQLLDMKAKEINGFKGSIFWAITLTATNFPDVTQVLTDLKLLRTDMGRLAVSSAVSSDFFSWILLVLAMSLLNSHPYYVLPSILAFVLLCVFVIRPAISKIANHVVKGDDFTDQHIWFILGWIVFFGFITDVFGLHSMVGGFMLGVIMPRRDAIRMKLMERLDDFVSGILMPLFFLTSGIRTDAGFMLKETPWYAVLAIIFLSFGAKILSTMLVFLFHNKPMEDGFALGVIMNTKGVLSIIIINAGRNIKVLNNQTFTLMVFSALAMTCMVEPLIAAIYKPRNKLLRYKNRTIESVLENGVEFKILACVLSNRDAPCVISLLEASNAGPDIPICVVAVHLVELTGRNTAMLIVHDQSMTSKSNPIRAKSESDQIIAAFKSYEKRNPDVSVQTITAISPYENIHEDICSLALDMRVSLIIIPFQTVLLTADGRAEDAKSTFPAMNQYVLENAPCSVGLLVDRGLGSVVQTGPARNSSGSKRHRIAMIFIGGPDDREALAYAWRMAGHPDHVSLTVLRFLPGRVAAESAPEHSSSSHDGLVSSMAIQEREKRLDDEYTYEFMFKTLDDESITYTEKVVNNGDETLAEIRRNEADFDLYIVGRGEKTRSVLTSGLSDWNSCKELGTMGDALASSNFASHASVLVIQQYVPKNYIATPFGFSASYGSKSWQPLMFSEQVPFGNSTSISHHYVYDQDEDDDDDDD